jgi:hypothetical protein
MSKGKRERVINSWTGEMTLSELFEQLSYGELSQLPAGTSEPGAIDEAYWRQVISHINLGLLELYKRFWVESGEVLLQLYDHIAYYKLHDRYAESNRLSPEPYRYIKDSEYYPFRNNVMKIEQVFNACGEQVCLNDHTACESLFTPAYDTLQVPLPTNYTVLTVEYRAGPEKIQYVPGMDPEEVEVDIPPGLLEPLVLFVGARAYRVMNPDQHNSTRAYMQLFEQACVQAHRYGLEIKTNYGNTKLDNHQWV